MWSAVLALTTVAVASASLDAEFASWALRHRKHYATDVARQAAFSAYQHNVARVQQLNTNQYSAVFELNQFADLDDATFKRQRAMPVRRTPQHDAARYQRPSSIELPVELPAAFDWRDKGAVTAVRDQGSIGSCWAFSTIQNIEGVHFLAGNQLVELSAEQLVDCDGSEDPAHGHADCGPFGGWPYLAYQYIINAGGVDSEANIPYCAGDGSCFPCPAPGYNATLCGPPVTYCNATRQTCTSLQPASAKITSWRAIGTDESLIAQELLASGPLSVLLNGALLEFYSSGVITASPSTCDPAGLDHAVLLVGYGTDPSTKLDYWIVKNSWGASWGMQGYFLLQRGNGACGINTAVTTSIA